MTDNGPAYKSHAWRDACTDLGITPKETDPTPQPAACHPSPDRPTSLVGTPKTAHEADDEARIPAPA
ncbi:hypothetical protein GCM10018962_80650 [Dactylosporangium matsuzakiense]|uniref:Uncharacterized protein n=1 Tax=Dactylosporangium matsuzakiense TaxID=53360 RepID=A0A9W6KWQ7_9ACTN|nr:hypothetical protein Dmats_13845 [Dactylosporangium matsuzakiense]GLL07805.1 hypothetical protein GCM10017581_095630 [Dactylosporangium matsuzakiense]